MIVPCSRTGWRVIWLIPLLISLVSCENSGYRENDHLRQEITRVHDLTMAEIDTLYLLKIKVKARPVSAEDNKPINRKQCLTGLEQADEAMFAWMRQYQPLSVNPDMSADTQYRVEQLILIKAVQDQMERAMSQAQACLAGGTI